MKTTPQGAGAPGARSPPHPCTARKLDPVGPRPDDPAWIDDPVLTVRSATARASIEFERALAARDCPQAATPPAIKTRRVSRKAAASQTTLIDTKPEITTSGKYD